MEDFTHQQNDSIPEGLEFNESYMNQAFEMYAAEKESRKRRFYIWFWSVSAGFAAIIGFCVFFFYSNENKQAITTSTRLTRSQKEFQSQQTASNKALLHKTDKKQPTFHAKNTHSGNGGTIIDSPSTVKSHQPLKRPNRFNQPTGQSTGGGKALIIEPTARHTGLKPTNSNLKTSLNAIQGRINDAGLLVGGSTDSGSLPTDSAKVDQGSTGLLGDQSLAPDSSDSTSGKPFDKLQRHHYYINFGVNTLFGISELKGNFNLRESVGFGYDYTFNQRYFLSFNAEFHSIAKIDYYRFVGENSSSSSSAYFTKTTLKYVSIAPKFGVNFGRRHSATLGFGMEYLLKNTGERFEIKEYTGNGVSKSTNNYYETFNRFNYSVSLGYGFRLSKHTSIFATYHFGLSDVTKNYGTTNTLDRNSRLQLLLRIKLF